MNPEPQITRLLAAARDGDAVAMDELLPLVYDELRALARRQRLGPGGTLNTTAVVHEAYLKVFGRGPVDLNDRRHFFGTVCLAMRQVLRDHARRRRAEKRGGGEIALSLDDAQPSVSVDLDTFLELDTALDRLERLDPRLAEVVHLRFVAGLEVEEVAALREQSTRTVLRDWRKARAFLIVALEDGGLS
jgi:RNA polymerase sigma factor (TIGR02999 family)